MRYIDCCKSTRKNKKCTRKDGKHFSLQRRFTKRKCIKGPVKGFTMRASCAPYKFCKQKGGTRKTRKLLPKLRKISYKNKKHHYKLKDPFSKRKLAIHEGVNREAKKTGKSKKKAAIAKKGRFNILRIYRKNKKIKECNTITHDMRYMDRKYGLGKTKNICGQKGGTYEFPPDRPDSTFSNIDDLKFILSFYSPHNNNKIIIKSYTGDEDEHQLKPELASDTHILIVGADYGIPFSLFQGAGFEIKPKGVEEYLRYVEPIDQSGGKKRKRKTRKKRGGNDPPWQRETLQPNPETFDDIGYFYDCKPMPMIGSTNKSKYRENMIITGDRDGNELMLPDEWKIIRMNDSETYDPQLQLVDMALPEGERGMRWFSRRAQSLCNRGYKPLKRNDAKTGAGRKKKTRRKRGGQGKKNKQTRKRARQEIKGNKIYENRFDVGDSIRLEPHYEDEVHDEDSIWDIVSVRPEEMSYMYELMSNDTSLRLSRPESHLREAPDVPQDFYGYGGGKRKKKIRKKSKKKQFLYNPNDPSKSFDVYIDKNPKDTIPIKYTTVKDVKDTIKKLERLYKTKKYPHKRIWQVGMIMKVRLEAMLKHKTKKYPNAKKVKQRFNLANKYFKFLGKRTKKKDFRSRKAMTFKF